MSHRLHISETFRRALKRKSIEMQESIKGAVAKLSENPRHPGLRTKGIKRARGVFEARIDGGNRITWEWGKGAEQGSICLLNNCNHDILNRPRG